MVAGNPGTWVAGVSAATHGTSASHAQRLEQETPDPSCLKQIYHDIVTGGVEVVPDGSSAVPINARQQSEFAAAAVQEPLEEMPPPAPGHHDAETHPEFDNQPIPEELLEFSVENKKQEAPATQDREDLKASLLH